ncbi:nitrogen fixation protein NifU and related proteins [Azospirillaceae bacterium]
MFDDLRELYQEVILDHGKHPRNFRHPPNATCEAQGDNPLCGDRLIVYLTLAPDGLIADAAFLGRGCAISTASASLMTEVVRGKTIEQAGALFSHFHTLCTSNDEPCENHDVSADDLDKLRVLSGVRQYPVRVKCATLPWHTLNAALSGSISASTE